MAEATNGANGEALMVAAPFHLEIQRSEPKSLIFFWIVAVGRRKFRSETSDNMDSWKAEVRRIRREKIRRKKMQVREKVGTSWNTESRDSLCFPNDLWLRRVEK